LAQVEFAHTFQLYAFLLEILGVSLIFSLPDPMYLHRREGHSACRHALGL